MNRIGEMNKTDGADEEGVRRATKEALAHCYRANGWSDSRDRKKGLHIRDSDPCMRSWGALMMIHY